MSQFKEGQELQAIYFSEGQIISKGQTIGSLGCVDSIKVEHENGQMAAVPWLTVTYASGAIQKWNGALVDGVLVIGGTEQEGGE